MIILLLHWHFGSWVGAFSVSAFGLWKMLGYCVVLCSAVMVLPFPTGPLALREGLGTPCFLGPLLSQALFCRWACPCFIRTQDAESHCPFTTPLKAGAPLVSFFSLCCLVSPGSCCRKPLEKELDDLHHVILPSSTLSIVQSPNLGHLHLSSVVFWDFWSSLSKEIWFNTIPASLVWCPQCLNFTPSWWSES